MASSFLPRGKFFDLIGENPDLYGPFWISTTVVFAMFVMGSVAYSIVQYLNGNSGAYNYDYTNLSFAAIAVYCYTFVLPLGLWGFLRLMGMRIELLKLICLYGYAMTVLIPVAVNNHLTCFSLLV